jgi:hypothetical protein
VRDVVPLDAEHVEASSRELVRRRAPDPADADDDRVVSVVSAF